LELGGEPHRLAAAALEQFRDFTFPDRSLDHRSPPDYMSLHQY
jgi:hypothetical protein